MKVNEKEIEALLRHAPKPSPPAGLKRNLNTHAALIGDQPPSNSKSITTLAAGKFRRWWPVLIPTAASLICAVVFAFQQLEIGDLEKSIQTLSKDLPVATADAAPTSKRDEASADGPTESSGRERAEIERLKQLATQLAAEVSALEQLQKGNEALRTQFKAPPLLTPDEMDAVADAKAKAMSIQCINNLKQFGLAVRVWALENKDGFPPDSLSMSNELSTPKILICPADTNRVVAKTWGTFSAANCTYEYLTPSATNAESDPQRILSRCPIHGHIGLCDGSVQAEIGKKHPEWIKIRDGKLYLEQ